MFIYFHRFKVNKYLFPEPGKYGELPNIWLQTDFSLLLPRFFFPFAFFSNFCNTASLLLVPLYQKAVQSAKNANIYG